MFAPSPLLLNVHVKNGEQGTLQFLNSSLWAIELHNIKIQRTGRHMPDQCTALLLAADLERSAGAPQNPWRTVTLPCRKEVNVESTEAILPIFETPEANSSVLLYDDQVTVAQGTNSFTSPGQISLAWLPSPTIRFQLSNLSHGTLSPDISEKTILTLNEGTPIPDCLVTGINLGGQSEQISGLIQGDILRGQPLPVAEARFIVSNLPLVLGTGISFPDGSLRRGRIQLAARGWILKLDPVPNHKELTAAIQGGSGYGITYSGKIAKEDGSEFTPSEAENLLDAFSWYSSFAVGRWVGAFLLQGIDASGSTAWQSWSGRRVDPYAYRTSWVDFLFANIFQDPFPGFVELWFDTDWHEELLTVIHWYLAANSQSGAIEGSIVQTQTAFELLSSAVLVEQKTWLSTGGYEKLPAADRIRLLLHWAGIPTDIPTALSELSSRASSENWSDTAEAMTAIRNTITHPTKKNRIKFAANSFQTRLDTWNLGLWNLELCLLRLFKYNGGYANRLTRTWAGQTDIVPWAN